MWGKKKQSRRNNSNPSEVLHVAAARPRGRAGKIFLLRLGLSALIVLAGIISIGILTWAGTRSLGQYLFFANDLFSLRRVKIECNGEVVTPKRITEYLALNACSNLFAFNMAAERAALLQKVPRLKNAEFTRRLPGELAIIIRERVPLARLEMGAYYLAIDGAGRVLGTAAGPKNLPIISGHDLAGLRPGLQLDEQKIFRALEVIQACATLPAGHLIKIAGIDVTSQDALLLTLAGGEKVKLAWPGMTQSASAANDQLEKKLARLAESLRSAAARGKKIMTIDLTLENNFPAQEY